MTIEQMSEVVPGNFGVLGEYQDEHGRECASVEYADARHGVVREEPNGSLRFFRSNEDPDES